jgi:hypothetical protein
MFVQTGCTPILSAVMLPDAMALSEYDLQYRHNVSRRARTAGFHLTADIVRPSMILR